AVGAADLRAARAHVLDLDIGQEILRRQTGIRGETVDEAGGAICGRAAVQCEIDSHGLVGRAGGRGEAQLHREAGEQAEAENRTRETRLPGRRTGHGRAPVHEWTAKTSGRGPARAVHEARHGASHVGCADLDAPEISDEPSNTSKAATRADG